MTLVDTNVIVDVLTSDPVWLHWSVEQLGRCRAAGPLEANEVTYAELAVRMRSEGELETSLDLLAIQLARTPTRALFAAGQAFGRYRAAGGTRTNLLPDFFIGAHADVSGQPILTRDPRRFRSYFPKVKLIAPP